MLLDSIVPADGTTVGVAMPIVVIFTKPVKTTDAARKTIEKAMKLTTSKPVTGAWHWMGDRQVEFRPKDYWPSGDKVTLNAEFKDVPDGYGRYGTHAYKHTFTIGSKFETKISAKHHTTKVYSGGKLVRTMPSDAGSPDFPSWDGTMAVVGKVRNEHMTSCSAGITCNKKSPDYYDGWYPYAVRLTYSGTFVHYSDADPQPGHSYGSHGCVHLSLANAKWYFKRIKVGDPVTITGSPRGKAAADNGYAAYNLSWSQWQSESGLGAFTTSA
jgi:lipoprotein-anchoring transpeptidase ErfK/SrfK